MRFTVDLPGRVFVTLKNVVKAEPLTNAQLAEMADVASSNCRAILADAQLLFEAGRYARAHALAVLALEEFGKHVFTVSALSRREEPGFWAEYHRRFRDHRAKLRQARVSLETLPLSVQPGMEREAVIEEMTEAFPRILDLVGDRARVRRILNQVTSDAATKLHGIYTDFGRGGVVQSPAAAIDREMAEAALQAAQSVTGVLELMESRGGWRLPRVLERIEDRTERG